MFQTVHFEFKGVPYAVPPNRILQAIAAVEVHVTMHELSTYMSRQTAPTAKVAMAYASLINFAGGNVSADEVFESMFDQATKDHVMAATMILVSLLVPKKPPDPMTPRPQMPRPVRGGARKQKTRKAPSKASTKRS